MPKRKNMIPNGGGQLIPGAIIDEGPYENTRSKIKLRKQRENEEKEENEENEERIENEENEGDNSLLEDDDDSHSENGEESNLDDESIVESLRGDDDHEGILDGLLRPPEERAAFLAARDVRRRRFDDERNRLREVNEIDNEGEGRGDEMIDEDDDHNMMNEDAEAMLNPNMIQLNDSINELTLGFDNPNLVILNNSIVGEVNRDREDGRRDEEDMQPEDTTIRTLRVLIQSTEIGRIGDVRDEAWRCIRKLHCKFLNIEKQPVGKISFMSIDGAKREVVHGIIVQSPILTEDDEIFFSTRKMPEGIHAERFRRDDNSKDKRLVMTCKDYGVALEMITNKIRLNGRQICMNFPFAPNNEPDLEEGANSFSVYAHDESLKDFISLLLLQLDFGFDWKNIEMGIATHTDSTVCKKVAWIIHRLIIGGCCLAVRKVL